MLNVNQVDDVLIKGEIIQSNNEYVQLENENVSIDNDNVVIENLRNEKLENEMLPDHNVNCMMDHVKHDNAQEPYISPNYNQHEGSKTAKWIIEIDEMIIANLEGKKSERTIWLWASRLYNMFFSNKTMVEQCQLFMHLLKIQR